MDLAYLPVILKEERLKNLFCGNLIKSTKHYWLTNKRFFASLRMTNMYLCKQWAVKIVNSFVYT
jgi:hypothetical protein